MNTQALNTAIRIMETRARICHRSGDVAMASAYVASADILRAAMENNTEKLKMLSYYGEYTGE